MGRRILELARAPGYWFWLWAGLLLLAASLYLWQPDATYALTIYSPWAPATLGYFGTIIVALRQRSKPAFFLSLAWLSWGLGASEEVHAVLRQTPGEADFQSFRYDGKRLRVISLNCAGGDPVAAEAVKEYHPDVVLLLETPSRKELEPVATRIFGEKASLIVGPDGTILSRYPLRSWHAGGREPMNYVGADLELPGGEKWAVVSLRLQPPVLRFDYWNPACWGDYAEGRRRRKKELESLWSEVGPRIGDRIAILGGDFNTPPDRSVRDILGQRLIDSGHEAGKGWDRTAVSPLPLVRIDQIWVDRRLRPLRTRAAFATHSDHWMVIADFLLPANSP